MQSLIDNFVDLNIKNKEILLIGLYPCASNILEYNSIINNELTCEQLCKKKYMYIVKNRNDLKEYLKEVINVRCEPYIKSINNRIKLINELLINANKYNYKNKSLTYNVTSLYSNIKDYHISPEAKKTFIREAKKYLCN